MLISSINTYRLIVSSTEAQHSGESRVGWQCEGSVQIRERYKWRGRRKGERERQGTERTRGKLLCLTLSRYYYSGNYIKGTYNRVVPWRARLAPRCRSILITTAEPLSGDIYRKGGVQGIEIRTGFGTSQRKTINTITIVGEKGGERGGSDMRL